jgi:hypothetical protein
VDSKELEDLKSSISKRSTELADSIISFLEQKCLENNYLAVELIIALSYAKSMLESTMTPEEVARISKSFEIVRQSFGDTLPA